MTDKPESFANILLYLHMTGQDVPRLELRRQLKVLLPHQEVCQVLQQTAEEFLSTFTQLWLQHTFILWKNKITTLFFANVVHWQPYNQNEANFSSYPTSLGGKIPLKKKNTPNGHHIFLSCASPSGSMRTPTWIFIWDSTVFNILSRWQKKNFDIVLIYFAFESCLFSVLYRAYVYDERKKVYIFDLSLNEQSADQQL